MEPNNICRALIVYGSYAPDGENHHLVSDLPGEWKQGKIVADQLGVDELAAGENDIVDAWMIEFSDCKADMFTPEWEAQEDLLLQRWKELDLRMGEQWARTTRRWWPASSEPEAGENGMIVVNIYLLVKHFSYLPSAISTHQSIGLKMNHVWLGYFAQPEYQQQYFEEHYNEDINVPISLFADEQYETWIDHDYMEVVFEASPSSIQDLVEDSSLQDEHIDELARRIREHRITRFNTLVIIDSEQINDPRSVYKEGVELHYLGQFVENE